MDKLCHNLGFSGICTTCHNTRERVTNTLVHLPRLKAHWHR